MSSPAMKSWLDEHDGIFDQLQAGLLAATGAAGDAGRSIDAGDAEEVVDSALTRAGDLASDFLEVINRASSLPPIPDADTARHFAAGLARWRDGAEAQRGAARRRDASEMLRAGRALEAGTAELYRAAAALRRASGQAPDPRNPFG